jgi:tRNA modification GTPase
MVYGHIHDGTERIDEVLACFMKSPSTYTGEDVVEIQSHGGYVAAESILLLALKHGVRPAEPGEFTKRAFLNGRIDLAQAEAVMEIVSAENREYLKKAEQLLDGTFSQHIDNLIANIQHCLILLEYNIDFQNQENDMIPKDDIRALLKSSLSTVTTMISSYTAAKRIKQGITVVLAGKVNAGKSSLFNTLLSKKRALVHSTPGTTRDWIEEKIEFNGIPVNLIDTAGIRSTGDEIECEGVKETGKLMNNANIILYLHGADDLDGSSLEAVNPETRVIHVLSKADLVKRTHRPQDMIAVSSKTREGLRALTSEIERHARELFRSTTVDSPVLIDRHQRELKFAYKNLKRALTALDTWSEEILSYELSESCKHLESVIGKNIDFQIFDSIFTRFCIGK